MISDKTKKLFATQGVLREVETEARQEVFLEEYYNLQKTEADTAILMVRQDIIPALVSHINLYKESGTKTHIDTGSLERLVLELEFYVNVLTHGGATTGTIKPPNTYQEK